MIGVRLFSLLFILTGILYPLLLLPLGSLFPFNKTLIGQPFTQEKYFWPRPSAISYDPLKSGASHLSPTSKKFQSLVKERRASLISSHPEMGSPPPDLLFSSGSGLDPHISIESALFQAERVAKGRQRTYSEIMTLIEDLSEGWKKPYINVLKLNLRLEEHSYEQ